MSINVIVCGINRNTYELTRHFKDNICVVKYTDIPQNILHISQFDGVEYGTLSDPGIQFDYLIISYESAIEIECALDVFNYCIDKIIVYSWFKDGTFINCIEKYNRSSISYEQLILGMSHSQNDIEPCFLNLNTFSFSLPSMDLFCHLQTIKQINSSPKVERVILELPYYIFNYDLSKSERSAKNRLYYFYTFNDYHHFSDCPEGQFVVKQFGNYLKVFSNCNPTYSLSHYGESDNSVKGMVFSIVDQFRVLSESSHVWSKEHLDTIEENQILFKAICEELGVKFPNAKLEILVCPFNPIFRFKNRSDIRKMKALFYKSVGDNTVHDYFDKYKNPFLFLDHCHLNKHGALDFTKSLKGNLGY